MALVVVAPKATAQPPPKVLGPKAPPPVRVTMLPRYTVVKTEYRNIDKSSATIAPITTVHSKLFKHEKDAHKERKKWITTDRNRLIRTKNARGGSRWLRAEYEAQPAMIRNTA